MEKLKKNKKLNRFPWNFITEKKKKIESHTGNRSNLPFIEHHIFMTLERAVNSYNQDLHVVNFGHLDHPLLE